MAVDPQLSVKHPIRRGSKGVFYCCRGRIRTSQVMQFKEATGVGPPLPAIHVQPVSLKVPALRGQPRTNSTHSVSTEFNRGGRLQRQLLPSVMEAPHVGSYNKLFVCTNAGTRHNSPSRWQQHKGSGRQWRAQKERGPATPNPSMNASITKKYIQEMGKEIPQPFTLMDAPHQNTHGLCRVLNALM